MKLFKLTLVPMIAIAALASGCAASDEYEVTGEVTSAVALTGAVTLQFYGVDAADLRDEGDTFEVTELGAFTTTIGVPEGSAKVAVMALEDLDGDGACTAGELWAEQVVTPAADGTLPALALALTADACPTVAAAE